MSKSLDSVPKLGMFGGGCGGRSMVGVRVAVWRRPPRGENFKVPDSYLFALFPKT
jgi:hypothetical protein